MKFSLTSALISASLLAGATVGFIATNAIAQSTPRASENITVSGTEPFWSMTINRSGLTFSTPDSRPRRFAYSAPLKAEGRPADFVRVYRLQGQANGMLVLQKTNRCSDGMSDRVYPYEAVLTMGNRVFQGCGR